MLHNIEPLKNMPAVFLQDAWINALFGAASPQLKSLHEETMQLAADMFSDTMSEKQLQIEEFSCGLDSNTVTDLSTRRSLLEARWKTGGKCGVTLLQAICDSWKDGSVNVEFVNGSIVLKFSGAAGVPENVDALKSAIEATKPAHLPVEYGYVYKMVSDVNAMTIAQMDACKMDEFAGGN